MIQQLETNASDIDLTFSELDILQESDDLNYDQYVYAVESKQLRLVYFAVFLSYTESLNARRRMDAEKLAPVATAIIPQASSADNQTAISADLKAQNGDQGASPNDFKAAVEPNINIPASGSPKLTSPKSVLGKITGKGWPSTSKKVPMPSTKDKNSPGTSEVCQFSFAKPICFALKLKILHRSILILMVLAIWTISSRMNRLTEVFSISTPSLQGKAKMLQDDRKVSQLGNKNLYLLTLTSEDNNAQL